MNDVSRKLGGIMIEYEDENPAIRTLYEPECAGHGVQVNMRPSQGLKPASRFTDHDAAEGRSRIEDRG